MSTRALTRTNHFDFERARHALRRRVVRTTVATDRGPVDVSPEPLVAREADGSLWQAVRVAGAGLDVDAKIEVRTAGGTVVATRLRPAPGGVRVLVPEVDGQVTVRLELIDSGVGVDVALDTPRHWRIHLVHHTHLDIGYTDPQGEVLREHMSFLDSCLDLVADTDDYPDDARFRWAVEALWSFERWSANRPASTVSRFLDAVRAGRIELTALPYNMHTETCSTDEMHELLRPARDLHRRHGVRIPTAMQTDVPGAVVGLVDALAQNDVRYLSVAHNWAGRSVPHRIGGQELPRLFRWAAPGGASVLVWMTDTPHGLAYMEGPMLGFDRDHAMVDDLLPSYLTSLADNPYPYDESVVGYACAETPLHRPGYAGDLLHLRVQGRFGDNAPPRRLVAQTVRDWNEQWAFPHLRLSRNEDFFTAAEQQGGDSIPTFTGDWNDWWADGIGSAARPVQLGRQAQQDLALAQTVSALAVANGIADATDDTRASAGAYRDLALFDEHTWGAGNPWTNGNAGFDSGAEQWHWKYTTALTAHTAAADLLSRATARLGTGGGRAPDALASALVANACGYVRSDVVRLFLPDSRVPVEQPVGVHDARTGLALPVEVVAQVNHNHRNAGRHLYVRVEDVPALGTVRIDVRAAQAFDQPEIVEGTVIDDPDVRVTVDPARAGVTSILDRRSGRELVRADATFAFNAYVYDRYVSVGGMNHSSGRLEAREDLNLLGTRSTARPAAIVEHRRSAVREWLTYESVADGAESVTTTVTVWRGSGRVEFANRVVKAGTAVKESAFFAFPFAAPGARVRTEVSGGVVGDGLPAVPGGAEHMRAMRHWVELADDQASIAWVTRDAPLVQHGDIHIPYPPFPGSVPDPDPGTVFSWIHNNIWDTNFPVEQPLDMTFQYAVAVDASTTASGNASRTADALRRPLVAALLGRDADDAVDAVPATGSIAAVASPHVAVIGLSAPAADRILLRLQSTAAESVTTDIEVAVPVRARHRTTLLGEPIEPVETLAGNAITVPPFGSVGLLLELEHTPSATGPTAPQAQE